MAWNSSDARGAWNETGEKLTDLGHKLKVHYEEHHDPDGQPTRQELADAARRVGTALQDAFEAFGAAARDKSVQADVKSVGHSLLDALGATLGQASDDVRRAFSERKGQAGATPASPAAEPSPPGDPLRTEPAAPSTGPGAGPSPAGGEEPSQDAPPPRVGPWGTP